MKSGWRGWRRSWRVYPNGAVTDRTMLELDWTEQEIEQLRLARGSEPVKRMKVLVKRVRKQLRVQRVMTERIGRAATRRL